MSSTALPLHRSAITPVPLRPARVLATRHGLSIDRWLPWSFAGLVWLVLSAVSLTLHHRGF